MSDVDNDDDAGWRFAAGALFNKFPKWISDKLMFSPAISFNNAYIKERKPKNVRKLPEKSQSKAISSFSQAFNWFSIAGIGKYALSEQKKSKASRTQKNNGKATEKGKYLWK